MCCPNILQCAPSTGVWSTSGTPLSEKTNCPFLPQELTTANRSMAKVGFSPCWDLVWLWLTQTWLVCAVTTATSSWAQWPCCVWKTSPQSPSAPGSYPLRFSFTVIPGPWEEGSVYTFPLELSTVHSGVFGAPANCGSLC